jgi:surface polysaccharide O-acyltransferase-like enzyme
MRTPDREDLLSGIDLIRFIGAIGIIALHSFMEYDNFFDSYIVRILVRWIVPFFFIVTGYFLKDDLKSFMLYLIHIFIQYLFWTLVYAVVLHYDIWSPWRFASALRSGVVFHFWYYPTLLLCSSFVWILGKIFKDSKWIIIICFMLFLMAVAGHTLINVPAFDFFNNGPVMRFHHRVIGETTTRDGIFWGSLYIAIGMTIRRNMDSQFWVIRNYRKFWSAFFVIFILTSLEEWLVIYYNTGEKDILFGTIPVSAMIFVFGLNRTMNRDLGESLRAVGNTVYVIHYFFLNFFMDNHFVSWKLFLLTLVTTLTAALVLVLVSKKCQFVKLII